MVKVLDRESINRMTGNRSSGGGGGGGSVDIDLAGYATKLWTDENYVGKEFFSSLFKAYDANGTEVLPNDTDTVIDNIKAMFGFWTDFYISALGTGGQSTVGLRLAQLADVNVAGVTNGQVLTYDTASGKWIASTPQSGTDMATVWSNLAASGNQQIDASHLSTALAGYATQTWVGQQGFITSSALNGYATQTWVGQQGYITSSAISDMATKTWVNSQISDMATKTWVNNQISDMATKTWANGQFLKLSGGTVTGTLVLSKTQDASGSADNGPALVVGGNRSQAHIEIDANEIIAKSGATGVTTLNLNDNGGPIWVAGDIQMTNNARIYNYAQGSNGSLYIGRPDDAGWVKISDMCSRQGDSYWKIYSNGNSEFANVYSRGYVTALSDARHKNVKGDIALTVEMVAKAPAVKFTWKDEKKTGMFVGSLAQYWQMALPEVVREQGDGTLSLDYQVTALMAAIVTARKVVNHESRLQRLEKMFAINENDLED